MTAITDPPDVRRILHPLREVLRLVVCATIADREDYDAIATNATIAAAITGAGADCLLAVKANQPTPRADIEACFKDASPQTIRQPRRA